MILLEFLLMLMVVCGIGVVLLGLIWTIVRWFRKPHDHLVIKLHLISSACPEAYEAYLGDKKVGYLRLRHGLFTVDYPDVSGKQLYAAYPKGDGVFENDERHAYLREATFRIMHEIDPWKAILTDYKIVETTDGKI